MINFTTKPIVLVKGKELDLRIRLGIQQFLSLIDEKYDITSRLEVKNATHSRGDTEKVSYLYFSEFNLYKEEFGDDFIQALANVAMIEAHSGLKEEFDNLNPFLSRTKRPTANACVRVKTFAKLLLFVLWCNKAIILPYNLALRGDILSDLESIINTIGTEVFVFFRNYKKDVSHRPKDASILPVSGAFTLSNLGLRVILTTDYHSFKDVNINEISQLSIAMNPASNLFNLDGSKPPFSLMLREMLLCKPTEVNYTSDNIDTFTMWSISPVYNKFLYEDFLLNGDKIKKNILDERKLKKRAGNKLNAGSYQSSYQIKDNELKSLSVNHDHESIVEYFCKIHRTRYNGCEWLTNGSPYVGREQINLVNLTTYWVEAWTSWMKYRKNVQGFDSTHTPEWAFSVLCDYLFLYLPWWKELFPGNTINIPLAPNQLKRALFINRTQINGDQSTSICELPLTLLDMLSNRIKSPDTRYNLLTQLILFLNWVEIAYEDDDRIAGKGYRNPIKRIDVPRIKKKTKTTKIPFTKRVYPHLLFYTYAIEAFGEYLQQIAMERQHLFVSPTIRNKSFFSTGPSIEEVNKDGNVDAGYLDYYPDNYGYVPYINYYGKNYPIFRVPNVYQWAERTIDLNRFNIASDKPTTLWIPHLTAHRMLTGAVETGLRLQSLQWLDLGTWDIINKRNGIPPNYIYNGFDYKNGRFAYSLYVPTDKTKEDAWDVSVPFRVRDCFHREQYFRDSIVEPNMDTAVDYELIENSRFGKILPLFRSSGLPNPVSDTVYYLYWIQLLWGFEEYFNENVSAENEFVQFVYLKNKDKEKKWEPVPDYSTTKIKHILAINTPHACRATYATNRTGQFMEASDVAQQLGHANTVATSHYTVSTPEIMEEKMESIEREIQTGFIVNSTPSYIRADSPDGALYRSFQTNREDTIKDFQFAPAVSLWNTEDLNSGLNGIELLKNSPMSQIVFRETHICPVGESCPDDIVTQIGAPKRCGKCPLAMRCVDHLTAIASRINQLQMNVRTNIRRAEQLSAKKEPSSSTDPLYESAEDDTNEAAGWKLSHDILLKMASERGTGKNAQYHTNAPEIVKKHLMSVTSNRSVSEFFLQRIADANAYPSMADPEIKRVAERYCRYILSGKYQLSLDDDPVALLAGYVKTQMEPLGLTLSDLAAKIDQIEQQNQQGRPALPGNQTFLLNTQEDE